MRASATWLKLRRDGNGLRVEALMRIAGIEVHALAFRLERPYGNSVRMNYERPTVVVEVVTEGGVSGWGDAPGNGPPQALALLGAVGELKGHSLREIAPIVDALRHRLPAFGPAVAAVETALYDAFAREAGVGISALFGGARRDRVPAYASGGYYFLGVTDRKSLLVEEAAKARERGYRAYKMKIGGKSVREDVADVQAVREAVGDEMLLIADANCAYSFSTALEMGKALERLGVHWYEEPLPKRDLTGYRELRAKLDTPVAGGEQYREMEEFRQALEARAMDVIQPDVAGAGGLARTLKVAALAATVTMHALATLPQVLGTAPGLAPMLEYDVTPNLLRERILVSEPEVGDDGCFAAPSGAGLGVEVNREALEEFAAE